MSASWTVTGDLPDQFSSTPGQTPVLGHQISFVTANGHRGSVFVPEDRYNEETVRAVIQPKADTVDAVNALTSES